MSNESKDLDFSTRLLHAPTGIEQLYGSLTVPIFQVSTYKQTALDEHGEFEYSRSGNPTRQAVEQTIANLEEGTAGFAFSSGMAAISSVFSIFSTGDEILIGRDIYGGTYRALTEFFPRFGIRPRFADLSNLESLEKEITPSTKAIYIETPSNPLLGITDIRGIVNIAKKHGLLTIADNTFMTPYLQKPLTLGVDIVIHSATKYIGGHSDVLAGLVVVKDEKLAKQIRFVQNAFGAVLGPQDSWLLLRGIRTLQVRLDRIQDSSLKIARFLKEQPGIEEVYYPGLEDHPGHDLHHSQATGNGGIVSFKLNSEEQIKPFLEKLHLPALAVSLGGVETILSYPATMSHAGMPKKVREELGITDTLFRLSVGLESPEDLINDLRQALS